MNTVETATEAFDACRLRAISGSCDLTTRSGAACELLASSD